ncbi:hypothetical protein MJG53_006648 [Ovis ammon polii x Ovis aries]|uniref:Uncharacterized protein n=1 Tax=Ovis ammon polii x Ovis aries TaxID=2918886 RepID=A0ACB9V693_9CETA|nr:hypothetical protein MJG53_006648 [Ovis ammon polii x Ovis aries]
MYPPPPSNPLWMTSSMREFAPQIWTGHHTLDFHTSGKLNKGNGAYITTQLHRQRHLEQTLVKMKRSVVLEVKLSGTQFLAGSVMSIKRTLMISQVEGYLNILQGCCSGTSTLNGSNRLLIGLLGSTFSLSAPSYYCCQTGVPKNIPLIMSHGCTRTFADSPVTGVKPIAPFLCSLPFILGPHLPFQSSVYSNFSDPIFRRFSKTTVVFITSTKLHQN